MGNGNCRTPDIRNPSTLISKKLNDWLRHQISWPAKLHYNPSAGNPLDTYTKCTRTDVLFLHSCIGCTTLAIDYRASRIAAHVTRLYIRNCLLRSQRLLTILWGYMNPKYTKVSAHLNGTQIISLSALLRVNWKTDAVMMKFTGDNL